MTVKNYVLDINKTSLQHPSIVLRQDDYNIYTVNISVTDNGTPVDLGSYTLNFLGITPAGAKIIDSKNFITNAGDLKNGKFSYKFPKEAAGSKGVYDVAYFRLKTTSGATSTIDLNLRVLGGIDLTADEVKDYITVDDTLRNTLVAEVFKKVDAKVDEHLATVKKGDKGEKGDQGIQGPMGAQGPTGPVGPQGPKGDMDLSQIAVGGRNYALNTATPLTINGTGASNEATSDDKTKPVGSYYINPDVLGKQTIVSYDLTLDTDMQSGSTINIQIYNYAGNWDKYSQQTGLKAGTTHVSFSWNVPKKNGTGNLLLRGVSYGYTGKITISNFSVALGNVATDWTPAPEDIDSAIAKAPKLNGNNMYVGDNTYMGTNTFMDGVTLSGRNNVNNVTDTDWLDIPLAAGRTGTAKYKVSLGKVFVHLENVKGVTAIGNNAQGQIGTLPINPTPYYTQHIAQANGKVVAIMIARNGTIYVINSMGNTLSENDLYILDTVLI